MTGQRYLANMSGSRKEVHDLDNEKTACRIDDIIESGYDKPYFTLAAACADGYLPCEYCIPRK